MAQYLIRLELRQSKRGDHPSELDYARIHSELESRHSIVRFVWSIPDSRLYHLPDATYGVVSTRTIDQIEQSVHLVAAHFWPGPKGIVVAEAARIRVSDLEPVPGSPPTDRRHIIQAG